MESNLTILLIVLFCVAMAILIRRGAKKTTLLGRFLRWWWNTSFFLVSLIPLCGWMANFIIADTAQEQEMKQERVASGEQADADAMDLIIERGQEDQNRQEEFNRLDTIVRKRYGSRLVDYNQETGNARLDNGKTVQIYRE